MLPEKIVYLSIFISLAGYAFYFKDIFYGQTRPNLVSWFLWALAPLLGAFFTWKAGAGLATLPIFLAGVGPLVVVIVCLVKRNAAWRVGSFDVLCGIFAFLALLLYALTRNLAVSILFAILSDALAAIPTIVKSWNFPETETGWVYVPGILNNVLALLVIKSWAFSLSSFALYLIFINTLILACIHRKKLFNLV